MTDAENPAPPWGTPEAAGPVRGRPPWGPAPMSPSPQWNPPLPPPVQWPPPQGNQAQWNPAQWNPNRPAPRELVLAYALLVLLGTFGLHRFYLRSNGVGGFYLALGLVGWATCWLTSGRLLLVLLGFLILVDFVTLPQQVRRANTRLWQALPSAF